MKLLETKEGIKAFYLYNDEEVYVYEDKVVIGDKTLPVNENECVEYKNGVLSKTITDKDDDLKYTFSRFDGNSFVEEYFRYENKEYFNSKQFCSTDDPVDGIVKVAFMDNGTEHLFEFESKKRYYILGFDTKNEILVLYIGGLTRSLLFYTKTGERLWEYTVKEGYEISGRGIGVTVVDDVVVIPCEEDGQPMSVEGYHLLTGEKMWEVNGKDYCDYTYVMGPNKMLYALHKYHCADHRVELRLTELNPFTGEVDVKVIKEGDYWGDVHVRNTTIHGNKLFYVNQNKEVGRSLGVVDLDTKEVIEDFALEAIGYYVDAPIVSDEKVYVLIYHDGVAQNELRIYENEYK